MKDLSRKTGLLLALIFFVLNIGGCQDSLTSSTNVSDSSTAANETSSSMTYEPDQTMEEKLELAPDIEGSSKQIQELQGLRRVIYLALPDNPYHFEPGSYLGEYKKEVWTGLEETGGVALVPAVVEYLLNQAIKQLPEGTDRWLVPLPVDISDCRSLRPVQIELNAKPFMDKPYYIQIVPDDELLDVVNILINDQIIEIGDFWTFGLQYVVSKLSMDSTAIVEGKEMAFLFVVAKLQNQTSFSEEQSVSFGERIGQTNGAVLTGLSSIRGPLRVHTFDCLLKAGNCPVFVISK